MTSKTKDKLIGILYGVAFGPVILATFLLLFLPAIILTGAAFKVHPALGIATGIWSLALTIAFMHLMKRD